MNSVSDITGSFRRGITDLINTIGGWGSYAPVDDSKSGIKIGDKTYQVVVSLNGCYWYLDENGKKNSIKQISNQTEWEWVNIAEKIRRDENTCYRTLGGKVQVLSWYLLNDQMDTLAEKHRIIDSTDVDNPVGTILKEIPDDWIMIDCDLPEMTERDITPINRCYRTENNGKVNIEGLESIDDKNNIRESIYTILQSTDEKYPVDFKFNVVPSTWDRIVCDFPDMTKRVILKQNICYATPNGKVHLDGFKIIDPLGDSRNEYYIVVETTDENIERLSVFTSIPENWNQIVCDFPDATTSDTEIIKNCYKTQNGKVELRTYLTLDGYGKVRDARHTVMRSTDAAYNIGAELDEIPNSWLNIDCDFASSTQRHLSKINACYANDEGKVYVEGYKIFNNNIDAEKTNFTVIQSKVASVPEGTIWNSIPVGFKEVVCNCNCFS